MLPEKFMIYVSKYFGYFMFWLENLVFLMVFICIEIILVFPVYVKNIFIIPWASLGLFKTIFNLALWIFAGLFISIFIAINDVMNLLNILRMHEGCRKFNELEDDLKTDEIDPET